jgi:hypothetical protein
VIALLAVAALSEAEAQSQGYQSPNSTIGASVGTPWLVGGRGEAWFADELSAEIGAGTLGAVGDGFGLDAAVRWRPDGLCFGCTSRALLTLGIGIGGTIEPAPEFDGPWQFAVGPDVAATFVYWFGPTYGLAISARGGVGPGWTGDVFDELTPEPWAFGTLGLAF